MSALTALSAQYSSSGSSVPVLHRAAPIEAKQSLIADAIGGGDASNKPARLSGNALATSLGQLVGQSPLAGAMQSGASASASSASSSTGTVKAENLFRLGDFCYFEVNTKGPYSIRRIEEITKLKEGHVEVKATLFVRRQELAPGELEQLLELDDRGPGNVALNSGIEANQVDSGSDSDDRNDEEYHASGMPKRSRVEQSVEKKAEPVDELAKLRHRELLNTKSTEVLAASYIRGKCYVHLLSPVDKPEDYLTRGDVFFWSMCYDRQDREVYRRKKGDIRIGGAYQATKLPKALERKTDGSSIDMDVDSEPTAAAADDSDAQMDSVDYETLVWRPGQMNDAEIDSFLLAVKSVGTFSRALDLNSSAKQPSIQVTAAAAARDATIQTGYDILHRCDYDVKTAMANIVGPKGPLLCRDQLEAWSVQESILFEEALHVNGKDFSNMATRADALNWKTIPQLVEYYYMWKTTDRYLQLRRLKSVRTGMYMKQFYMNTYLVDDAKQPARPLGTSTSASPIKCFGCESTLVDVYYPFGSSSTTGSFSSSARGAAIASSQKVCRDCWLYWRRYAALRTRHPANSAERRLMREFIALPPERSIAGTTTSGGALPSSALSTVSCASGSSSSMPSHNQLLTSTHRLPMQSRDSAPLSVPVSVSASTDITVGVGAASAAPTLTMTGNGGARVGATGASKSLFTGGSASSPLGCLANGPSMSGGGPAKAAFRTRVSICLEVTPESRLIRRLFAGKIGAPAVAQNPCKCLVSAPGRQEMQVVDAHQLAIVALRRFYRPRRSIIGALFGAKSVSVLENTPKPEWLRNLPQVRAAVAQDDGTRPLAFKPSEPMQVMLTQTKAVFGVIPRSTAAAVDEAAKAAVTVPTPSAAVPAPMPSTVSISSGDLTSLTPPVALSSAIRNDATREAAADAAVASSATDDSAAIAVGNGNLNSLTSAASLLGADLSLLKEAATGGVGGGGGGGSVKEGKDGKDGSPEDFCWVASSDAKDQKKLMSGRIRRLGRNPLASDSAS